MSEEGMTGRELWFVCFPAAMPDPPLVLRRNYPKERGRSHAPSTEEEEEEDVVGRGMR